MNEDLYLLIVRDADHAEAWTDVWERSYPLALTLDCRATDPDARWQENIAALVPPQGKLVLAACGAGACAAAAWYGRGSLREQKRVAAVILVSPPHGLWRARRLDKVRFACRTAWVADGEDDAARHTAETCGARWFVRERAERQHGNGWEWGMRLMQEMLD